MTVLQSHDVWRGYIGVLVRLIRIVSRNTSLGRKRKLGDNVADLVLGLLLIIGSSLIRSGAAPIGISSCWRTLFLLLFSLLLQPQLLRVGLHALITLRVTAQALAWQHALGA